MINHIIESQSLSLWATVEKNPQNKEKSNMEGGNNINIYINICFLGEKKSVCLGYYLQQNVWKSIVFTYLQL